ncbi:MAG TPA: hypothetical protein VFJ85_18660 [Acidimicrobiales bacterium]|nr:hypothetical protein [Acidimicrobiales bacterium]
MTRALDDTADILSRLVGGEAPAAEPTADIVVLHPELASSPARPPAASVVAGRRARRQRPRWLVAGVAVLLIAVAGGIGVRIDMGARDDLQRAKEQVADMKVDVRATKAELAAITADRDAFKAQLDARTAELDGAKGTLKDAQSRLNLQSDQLDTVRACIHGIEDAIVYAAQGQDGRAEARLNAVQGACNRSDDILG